MFECLNVLTYQHSYTLIFSLNLDCGQETGKAVPSTSLEQERQILRAKDRESCLSPYYWFNV